MLHVIGSLQTSIRVLSTTRLLALIPTHCWLNKSIILESTFTNRNVRETIAIHQLLTWCRRETNCHALLLAIALILLYISFWLLDWSLWLLRNLWLKVHLLGFVRKKNSLTFFTLWHLFHSLVLLSYRHPWWSGLLLVSSKLKREINSRMHVLLIVIIIYCNNKKKETPTLPYGPYGMWVCTCMRIIWIVISKKLCGKQNKMPRLM